MSRLFKLKEWLTVKDAARHLSILFGEPVHESDVLRLALDGQLKLSVYFVNHAHAVRKKLVPWKDVEKLPSLDGTHFVAMGDYWDDEYALVTEETDSESATTIRGVFDLSMRGAERLDVEHEYQRLTGGPEVTLICLDGPLVQSMDGQYWGVRDSFDPMNVSLPDGTKKTTPRCYYPAAGLPVDGVLVVRPAAIQELVKTTISEPDKTLSTTERNTLLKLVIGMAVKCYVYDPKASKSTTPKEIADDLAGLGISITDDTVRKYLKEAAQTFLPEHKQKA
ncbi:MAG: hypothetical protein ACK4F8_09690 [Aquabacterium sp.]